MAAVVPNTYLSRVSDFHVLIPAGETSTDVTVTAVMMILPKTQRHGHPRCSSPVVWTLWSIVNPL